MSEFKPLGSEEKIKIMQQMQAVEALIYFKFSDTEVIKVKALPTGSRKIISCKRPPEIKPAHTNKSVTLNFVLNHEIYFMSTLINVGPKEIHFNLEPNLLHLVRRKNPRIKIPANYDAVLTLKRLDKQITFLKAQVLDFSNEGIRLGLASADPEIPSGAVLEGTLKIPGKQGLEINGQIRHVKRHPRSDHKQVFGVKFEGMSAYSASRIKGIFLELQRELFLRILE